MYCPRNFLEFWPWCQISFFLWEIENPPAEMRLACGTLVLGPRLFVSVFSWCVGFILILLQFRWPRTY